MRTPPTDIERIVADYQAGKPMVEISWKYGRGLDTIRRVVREALRKGVPRRRIVTSWRRFQLPPKQIVPWYW